MYKIFDYLANMSSRRVKYNDKKTPNSNAIRDIVKLSEAEENGIDIVLNSTNVRYLNRVEHALKTIKSIIVCNYIIVFENVANEDTSQFVIKDIILFYINNLGIKKIEYKNIKKNYYNSFDPNITKFADLKFANLVKGGIFNTYGFVSLNNACYDITNSLDYDRLHKEISDTLQKW